MSLLVDTGATASLMTKKDFDMLFASKHRLLQTSIQLQNFSKHRIPVLGYFRTDLQHHGKRAFVTFYVTAHGTSLLGLDAIQQLGLLIDGATLTCRLASPVSSQLPAGVPPGFEHLFDGELGLVRDYVHRVKRRPDIVPVSAKLRRLPLALRQQVASELRRLEDNDVIERVSASEWVSPLVVVRKKDGDIRLCVDLREPNKAIVVDGFPLPHVDELLQMLNELLPRQSIPSAPAVQCDDAPAEVHTPMPATQDQPSGLQGESPGCSSSPTVNAPNSNTGEGRDGIGSSKSAQDSRSPQSFLPGSDGNGSSELAHGSHNPPSSSGRDGDGSSKSAPDSRNSQSLPAGPGSRRPQRTRKPPAHLKDYITD
ncbi:uncharacterized protein K02A2.6-like [Rhipicephalus sanguineus]|uniref:uncharacterized protein K02A2.6-like n=1 Tax=Rhipicephalus sanguineus TaxID=34632 RepID=UPI0020C51EE7|nr:uncharacterized protein K02A2.6-like [Rhipicephalus sanguineus]